MTEQEKNIVLDMVRFNIAADIGKAAAQMTQIDELRRIADVIRAKVQTTILAQKIEDKIVSVDFPFPANWWEHLKLALLPKLPRKWRAKINVKLSHYTHAIRIHQHVGYPQANEILEDRWGKPVLFEKWESLNTAPVFESVPILIQERAEEHP